MPNAESTHAWGTPRRSGREDLLFPRDNITRDDLARYYETVAEAMLLHARGRPITMHRYPNGIDEKRFFQHKAPSYFPSWVPRAEVRIRNGHTQSRVVIEDAAVLAYLATQACVTPHMWLSRKADLEHPDLLIFDLDPTRQGFMSLIAAAARIRELLEHLGLPSFVQVTGSRGLHIFSPLKRGPDFEEVRVLALEIAAYLSRRHPETLTDDPRRDRRRGRVYLDVSRNAYGGTVVAPYAVRARRRAPVAAPIDWKELEQPDLHSQSFKLDEIAARLEQRGDPWKSMWAEAATIRRPLRKLQTLAGR